MVVKLTNIGKTYTSGEVSLEALKNINLQVKKGDFLAVIGASGSGKSTLMNIIGLLDSPTEGNYELEGKNVAKLTEDTLASLRNQKIGFVFQSFNLLPRTSSLDNVALPLIYAKVSLLERISRAKKALTEVGLADKLNSHPSQLSGGQQQRVAIARALVNNPEIILADEPTGNLDSKSSLEIIKILKDLNKNGATIIMITHELTIAKHAKRKVHLRDGKII